MLGPDLGENLIPLIPIKENLLSATRTLSGMLIAPLGIGNWLSSEANLLSNKLNMASRFRLKATPKTNAKLFCFFGMARAV